MRRTGLVSFGAYVAGLAVAAFAIRMLYIFVVARTPVGVGGDASFYHSAANLIAQGHFYYRRIFGHAYPTALHPPLYSLLLSLVALLGGVHVLAQRIVGCLLGSVSVGLIAVLARSVAAGRYGGALGAVSAKRAGIGAGVVAAIYPPFITADGSLMSEPLYVLLVILALLLAVRMIGAPTTRASAVLGGVIGLAILTRTEALLLLPLLVWPAAHGGLRDGASMRLLAATVASALVLAPWVGRNVVVFHRLMLAANYDTVIPAANCHQTYYGHDIGWWRLDCLARARTHRQLLIGDASASPGLRYARRHPARAALVGVVRVLRSFSFYQPLRLGNHEPRRNWVDAVGLAIYYPLLVAAALGLRRLRSRRWLLLAPVWTALLVSASGWGNGRFRIGADISLIVLAALVLTRRGIDQPEREAPAHRPPALALEC